MGAKKAAGEQPNPIGSASRRQPRISSDQFMRIAFYMPFKPPGHGHPSGDLTIGTELFEFLKQQGHDIRLVSRLRSRWIYWKPWIWPALLTEVLRIRRQTLRWRPDVWLTYHTYYKAPDLLGPAIQLLLDIPYVIFQGVYSTKQRRRPIAAPGFYLNRMALSSASLVLTNKRRDHRNLSRLIHSERLFYVAPGIRLEMFSTDDESRKRLRRQWGAERRPVIVTAAMFRPGVKTDGILQVIRACRALRDEGLDFRLVVVGDGAMTTTIRIEAQNALADRCVMAGRIPRDELHCWYGAGDLFAFPGIQEGLGMVYLEAQACGLPVVALKDWGASEAVIDGKTGILASAAHPESFTAGIRRLLEDPDLRNRMAKAAKRHIRSRHDLEVNYRQVDQRLREAVSLPGILEHPAH